MSSDKAKKWNKETWLIYKNRYKDAKPSYKSMFVVLFDLLELKATARLLYGMGREFQEFDRG